VTWSERIAGLQAAIAERERQGLRPQVSVKCAACGQATVIQTSNVEDMDSLFLGWYLADRQPYLDYCPDCAPGRAPRRWS
jgi:hypothetical protein